MKVVIIVFFSLLGARCFAQSDVDQLTATVKDFHQALVKKDIASINRRTDQALSYVHSNGWVETKADVIKDLQSGLISYESFKEDSITISMSGAVANVRYVADVSATLKGTTNSFHLKVLEVWVKKDKEWLMFGRQAVKIQ